MSLDIQNKSQHINNVDNNNIIEYSVNQNKNITVLNNTKGNVSKTPQPVFINTSNVELNKINILDSGCRT